MLACKGKGKMESGDLAVEPQGSIGSSYNYMGYLGQSSHFSPHYLGNLCRHSVVLVVVLDPEEVVCYTGAVPLPRIILS